MDGKVRCPPPDAVVGGIVGRLLEVIMRDWNSDWKWALFVVIAILAAAGYLGYKMDKNIDGSVATANSAAASASAVSSALAVTDKKVTDNKDESDKSFVRVGENFERAGKRMEAIEKTNSDLDKKVADLDKKVADLDKKVEAVDKKATSGLWAASAANKKADATSVEVAVVRTDSERNTRAIVALGNRTTTNEAAIERARAQADADRAAVARIAAGQDAVPGGPAN